MTEPPLWAPWRMAYIQSNKVRPADGDCFLCEATDGDPDPLMIGRTDDALVILNRFPYNPGHLLVAPVDHIADYATMPEEIAMAVSRLTRVCVGVLGKVMNPQGYNVGINLGAAAGAGVPGHLHVHVIPRWTGDNNFMPVVGEVRVLPELLEQTAARVRPVLQEAIDSL